MMDKRQSLSDWDVDFRDGENGENLLKEVIETSEVKTDFRWKDTLNLYIEQNCFYRKFNEYRPSGISVTKANYWSFVLTNGDEQPIIVSVPTKLLKEVVDLYGKDIACVNTENPSKAKLIKVGHIIKHYLTKGEKHEQR